MPTVEERLAALEARMAAWIDQQPTNYYTHQYSGEEIDAAVGRALTGGALDTSVTNVSNQLGTFTRPNLLDNWYFGNPVDQRKGYIQIAGTMMYKDTACTDQFGPSAGTTPVVVYATYARPIDKGVELALYIPLNNIVRGYTGAFVHTIDRWQLGDGSISFSVVADGIVVKGSNSANTDYIFTRVERLPVGKYTFSVLFADNTANVVLTTRLTDISVVPAVESREASGVLALTWDQPEEFNSNYAYFRIHVPGSAKILAAKLELGPTQSLAHQENGVWVMNAVPEYGEQLRRCQRYHYQVHYNQYETIGFAYDGPEYAFIILPLPTEMRGETPILKIIGDISIGGKVRTLTGCNCHGCEAIIGVNYTAQPSSAGATYAYSTSAGGVTISIIYDL